jgi:hypothetical protein
MNESFEGKTPQELLELNTIRDNEAFLEALATAVTFEDVKDIIEDQVRVVKNVEEDTFDYVIGHVYIDAEGKKAARFFHKEELLELVTEIEKNPSLGEQDIVRDVEHTDIADALIRIAADQ